MKRFTTILVVLFLVSLALSGCTREEDNYIPYAIALSGLGAGGEDVGGDDLNGGGDNGDGDDEEVTEPALVLDAINFGIYGEDPLETIIATLGLETTFGAGVIRTIGMLEISELADEIVLSLLGLMLPEETELEGPIPAGEVHMGYDGRLISYTVDLTAFWNGPLNVAEEDEDLFSAIFRLRFTYDAMGHINSVIVDHFVPRTSNWSELLTYMLINTYEEEGEGRILMQQALIMSKTVKVNAVEVNLIKIETLDVYTAHFGYCEDKSRVVYVRAGGPGPRKVVYDYTHDVSGRLLTRTMSLLSGPVGEEPMVCELSMLSPVARTTNTFEDGVRISTIMSKAVEHEVMVEEVMEIEILWIPFHVLTYSYDEITAKLIRIDFNNVTAFDEMTLEPTELLPLGFAELIWVEMEVPVDALDFIENVDILVALDGAFDYFAASQPVVNSWLLGHIGL